MRMSALFGAKTTNFLKFMVCPHGRGVLTDGVLSQCGHFANKGDQFFAISCGRLLWMALNL